jgi:PHD/YefM family antitoxin component YafN of YafNO toxin-antitoxin module
VAPYILLYTSHVEDEMAKRRMVSEARKELFELFDEVTATAGRKVILGHRNSAREAVLVSRDYLEGLEAANRQMRGLAAREPFHLYGSAKLNVAPEEVLTATRREQREAAEAKLGTLSGRARR